MKNSIYKNLWSLCLLLSFTFSALTFTSCEDDKENGGGASPVINKVYLEDAQSTVPDRLVEFARLGQTIRLEGSGFQGVKKIYVNGYSVYFNPVYMTDNNLIFRISSLVPVLDAEDNVRNTIRLEKSETKSLIYPFEIRSSAPSIASISHTMPQAGDEITIYGTGLQEATQVIFPGGGQGTNISSDDVDGKWLKVTVPGGITQSGSLTVICANGGAYSPPYFNYKEGLFHNFDDIQNYAWGSNIDNTALTAVIPSGKKPQSQGGYQVFNSTGSLAANGDQRFWLNSTTMMNTMSVIPASTPADGCGIQMDIYVEGEWNSGLIRFVMADGWGATRYCMLYQPIYVDGSIYDKTAFENPGSWFTITLPFSTSPDFVGKTLGDIVAQMSTASYMQAGPWFENSGIKDVFEPIPATEKVYFDNVRIVPLTAPTYSDFPDGEE